MYCLTLTKKGGEFMKYYWFGKSKEQIERAIDDCNLKDHGKKTDDLAKPAPLWSREKLMAYQKMTRKFK
jgi:hypothetical protein